MVANIRKIINQPLTPGRILLSFTCVIALRTFLEVFSRRRSLFLWDDFHRVVVYYLHQYISWLSLFAVIALLMALFLKLRYREAVLFTLLFSPVPCRHRRALHEQTLFFLYIIPSALIAVLTATLLARENNSFRLTAFSIPVTGCISIILLVTGFVYTAGWLDLADRICNPGDLLKLAAAVLSLYLLFLSEELHTGNPAGEAGPVLLTLSAIFGAASSAAFVLFWLLLASILFLYGHSPFELRRFPVIRHLGEALIAVAALLAGASLILPYGPWRPFVSTAMLLLLIFLTVAAISVGVRRWKARSVA